MEKKGVHSVLAFKCKGLPGKSKICDSDALTGADKSRPTRPNPNTKTLWYPSANRDEAVFDQPDHFDPTRSPNLHVSFGFGTHFSLGTRVGRLQVAVMLREMLTRLPDIDVVVPARRAHSTFLNSPKSLGVRFTPARAQQAKEGGRGIWATFNA